MREVNDAILEEIRKALNKLFKMTAFPPAYQEFPGEMDYQTFLEKLGSAMEQEAHFGHLWIADIEAEKSLFEYNNEKSSSPHPDAFQIGQLFLSPKYNPPEEIADIVNILWPYECGIRLT